MPCRVVSCQSHFAFGRFTFVVVWLSCWAAHDVWEAEEACVVHACMYGRMYVCMYVRMYVCMYVCMNLA